MRLAKVKTVNSPQDILIAITSADKPEIPFEIQNKWQKIVDLAAKIIGVPSGLVTRLSEDKLEVLLTSKTEANIFEKHMKFDLGLGWYCENVAGTRSELALQNAADDKDWKENNPSLPFGIVSYMGMPIMWPDGEVFGTFCMLDNKENKYSDLYKELLISLREIIQNDLNSLLLFQKAQNDLLQKETQLNEIHHRIKNQFNVLISTLRLQTLLDSKNNSIKDILADVESRVKAISMVHDKLYQTMNLENVMIGDYLNGLGNHIVNSFAQREIKYLCISDQINVSAKISLTCGLILNELLTNSIKYAFANTDHPEIKVNVHLKNHEEILLKYEDNGAGLPENFDIEKTDSLGMIIVKQSVMQLGGSCDISNQNGFCFSMSFKFA
ncbi:MAG: histidine kinase dimerization/phosphoacceptor domain -containing protein [bacterium]